MFNPNFKYYIFFFILLQTPDMKEAVKLVPDAVVALDGTGNFTLITDAISAANNNINTRFTIYVKKGVYHEYVVVNKPNIIMYGDGIDVTIVTGNRSAAKWGTYQSATFGVDGDRFVGMNMTFENTAGPENYQAVAFRSTSDHSALFYCAFRGYQDTLYVHSNRQFFRECIITGTIDFIFGDATVVFQNCEILIRKGITGQGYPITAQGRINSNSSTGFSIQNCNISADVDLLHENSGRLAYLGRPWKPYSRTVVMQTYISDIVAKEGWSEWNDTYYLSTLYYAEYKNVGPGAELGDRVKWPGYYILSDKDFEEAKRYTVNNFIEGDSWLPETGVRYKGGM